MATPEASDEAEEVDLTHEGFDAVAYLLAPGRTKPFLTTRPKPWYSYLQLVVSEEGKSVVGRPNMNNSVTRRGKVKCSNLAVCKTCLAEGNLFIVALPEDTAKAQKMLNNIWTHHFVGHAGSGDKYREIPSTLESHKAIAVELDSAVLQSKTNTKAMVTGK